MYVKHCVGQVLHLFAESVGEPGEASHTHPHGEVLALHVRGVDFGQIGVAVDAANVEPGADGGAVAALALNTGRRVVNLVEHRVIDVPGKRGLNGVDVETQAVGGELDPVGEPRSQVPHENFRIKRCALTHEPAGHQLRVAVDRRPCPHIAVAELALVLMGTFRSLA